MSDKQWYEGKSLGDLEGLHVSVVYDDGSRVEGRLDEYGYIDTGRGVGRGTNAALDQELFKSRCFPAEGVKSVSLVWDERDWDQIDVKDMTAGDAAVVNGRRVRVSGVAPGVGFATGDGGFVPVFAVSCALRSRPPLLHEPESDRRAE